MLQQMRVIVSNVQFLSRWLSDENTGNQIAKNLLGVQSRATTYRHLKKAENKGFIQKRVYNGCYVWSVTELGIEFLIGFEKLKGFGDA